jgi:hypothetical protein
LYSIDKAYPTSYFPFPIEENTVPNFATCQTYNERKTLKATHTCDQKTRSDIVTMNSALSDVVLANLPKAIGKTYKPIHMDEPNTVFLHMFDWFITKNGKTMNQRL